MKKNLFILSLVAILPCFVWGQANTTTLTSYGYLSGTGGTSGAYFGINAGSTSSGICNSFFGYNSGRKSTGGHNSFFGYATGSANTTGDENVFMGYLTGVSNTIGNYNVIIGSRAGMTNSTGESNLYLGIYAGYLSTGSSNVFLGSYAGYNENGSNKLYIDNSNTTTPLIYGDFSTNALTINGTLGITSNTTIGGTLGITSNTTIGGTLGITSTVNMASTADASGTTGTGVLQVGGSLRFDGNEIITNTATTLYLQNDNNGDLSVDNNTLFVDASTNTVGIGTTDTKGSALGVNGTIAALEVMVATYANWPDYVFNEDYKLNTLSEVEAFIKENKHLPGVPSASEVEKDGQSLGEMNKVLLQKVEELTLYMIELKKENESIKKQLEQLAK